ncbi:MAG TPA: S8 family serine peptidase [Solirubrobacterales bacterium]|nr:S8 family serine peptidase [Solirubrobacterales bacterium]
MFHQSIAKAVIFLTLSAVPALVPAPSLADDAELGASSAPAQGEIADRVIVQWLPSAERPEKVAARDAADVDFVAQLGALSFQLVEAEPGQSAAAAARELEADPAVAVAEPDGYRTLNAVPDDPLFSQLWGLRNAGAGVNGFTGAIAGDDVGAVAGWDRTIGSPTTVVAHIDSGYRFDDPDLGPVAWTNPGEAPGNGIDDDGNGYVDDVHGYDFVGDSASAPVEDADPTDDNLISGGHGLHTAGTIGAAGNNGVGVTGVARNARIMPLRVCANQPSSNETRCPFSSIVAGINYAGEMGARVANMSLGGNTFTQAEVNAIAAHPQTLYVISAGNDGGDNDGGGTAPLGHHYPCDYQPTIDASPPVPDAIDNIICVAATDQADGLAGFSDYGAASVDLGAPGSSVLSTFPAVDNWLPDDFETNDFASLWTPYGAGFGRAGAGDGPLTSFGITDTPAAAPEANHIYGVESTTGTALPAGTGSCRIKGMRYRKGGSLTYGLFLDGSTAGAREFTSGETAGGAMVSFRTVPILGLGGHSLQMFFEYGADSTPLGTEGAWLDDLRLECYAPLTAPLAHAFLDGTSMAAPHVSGAAALLFSLKPDATVTEVRDALLDSVDPVDSLAGKTTTGGRLDVAAALETLVPVGDETVPPETALLSRPPASTTATSAHFQLRRLDADGGGFQCKLDSGSWKACAAAPSFEVAVGEHELEARATDPGGLVDPTPVSATWSVTGSSSGGGDTGGGTGGTGGATVIANLRVEEPPAPETPAVAATCTVPKLAGKTMAQAKSALTAAGCKLGRIDKPKPKKGKKLPKLIVKSSTPGAGIATGGTVDLKLGPKPKKRHH